MNLVKENADCYMTFHIGYAWSDSPDRIYTKVLFDFADKDNHNFIKIHIHPYDMMEFMRSLYDDVYMLLNKDHKLFGKLYKAIVASGAKTFQIRDYRNR